MSANKGRGSNHNNDSDNFAYYEKFESRNDVGTLGVPRSGVAIGLVTLMAATGWGILVAFAAKNGISFPLG